MVIGRTPLTSELYRGYIVDEYQKNYAVNIRNRFKSVASHIVVVNYRKRWLVQEVTGLYDLPIEEENNYLLFEAEAPYYGKTN